MDRADVHRLIENAGCRVVRPARDGMPAEFDCSDPWAKVRLLNALAIADARYDRKVRKIALAIAKGSPSTAPAVLAARILRVVQRRVRYVGEGIETFQPSSLTWRMGLGDCDDSARLVVALSKALGLDARVIGVAGKKGDPVHAVAKVEGRWAEASLRALYGEHPLRAFRRLYLAGHETRNYHANADDMGDLGAPGPNDADRQAARAALSTAWDMVGGLPPKTDAALQMVQAVALGAEGSDGGGCWSHAPGVCHNWGGVQLPHSPVTHDGSIPACPPGSAPSVDTTPNADGSSTSYGVCFKTYPTQAAGAEDYLRTLVLRSNDTQTAVVSGSARQMARAMYESHYFQGFGATEDERIENYAKAIVSGAERIAGSLGEPVMVTLGGGGVSAPGAGAALGLAAAALGLAYAVRRGWHRKILARL